VPIPENLDCLLLAYLKACPLNQAHKENYYQTLMEVDYQTLKGEVDYQILMEAVDYRTLKEEADYQTL
jgi:hypothetical protein